MICCILPLSEKHKKEEELNEVAAKKREHLAKQKHEERLKSLTKSKKIDLSKCPLLTRPAQEILQNRKINENKSVHHLLSEFTTSTFFLDKINSEVMISGYNSSDTKLNIFSLDESKKKILRRM